MIRQKRTQKNYTPRSKLKVIQKEWYLNWQLYLLLFLPISYFILFKYVPIYGIQIAFKDFSIIDGVWGSPWVGFKHFITFFTDYRFFNIIGNTFILNIYQLIASFPIPILFALSLNAVNCKGFKKTLQMITYAPHFISTVVMVGMVFIFFSTRTGLFNQLLVGVGFEEVDFIGTASSFRHLYVWSGVWQSIGFNSIIYIATLAGIDPTLHEAAIVDGASKFKRLIHIDLPGIMPTAIVLLILNSGKILNLGFEKVLLMQNDVNMQYSEIIATYVYKTGLKSFIPQFSYSTAIGLFQSLIGLIMIISVNKLSQKFSESSLW
ncbi:ABC transporter permease [Vallitalea okinawensis]|uniref:ABC transporter permease n=1 Tax=Vallitalea okinawensis TaxID=2078660 RepID=UPI000CFB4F2B|nr:ABC transporter permease subunit [Vallitalea okinawensis]